MQQSRSAGDASLYARAETAYRQALSMEPDNTRALLGLAWVRNSGHEFDAGRQYAERVLHVDPDNTDAHLLLSDIAVERGDYHRAFGHLQFALDRRPDLGVYSRAGHLLWVTGEPERARELMRRAIRAGSSHADDVAWCRAEYALMLFHAGELDAAANAVSRAIASPGNNPRTLAIAGRISAARGDAVAAEAYYRRSLAITPRHEALVGLVDLYVASGRHEEAETLFRDVLVLHDVRVRSGPSVAYGVSANHIHASAPRALFLADHDRDLELALAEARAAHEAFPNVYAADALAWSSYKNGLFTDARAAIDKALEWNTPDASIHYHAGMIYAALDETEVAAQHLNRALALNPYFHARDAARARQKVTTLSAMETSTGAHETVRAAE